MAMFKSRPKTTATSTSTTDEKLTTSTATNIDNVESPISEPIPAQDPANEALSGWRLLGVQVVLCIGLLLAVMDSSIIATALVTIGTEFDDFTRVIWSVLSYLLAFFGLAIIFARISDVVGRKWGLMLSWFIFLVFSLAAGFSQTLDQLIAFRALQGAGGSGLYSLILIIMPEITPTRWFPAVSGAFSGMFATAAVLGPVIGGIITHNVSWRWIFWINPIAGVPCMVVLAVCWPSHIGQLVKRVKWRQVDWTGAMLLLAASVLLVTGLQEAGSTAISWGSGASIAIFTMSGVCWVAFVAWIKFLDRCKHKTEIEPIFPLTIITESHLGVQVVTVFCAGFSFILVLIYLPERYQIVQTKDAIEAAVDIMPMLCLSAFGSGVAAIMSKTKNVTFWTLLAGCAFTCLGAGLLSTAPTQWTIPAREYGHQAIFGFGTGMVFASNILAVPLQARFEDLAVTQGVISQARVFGGTIALTVGTIVFNDKVKKDLPSVLTPAELAQILRSPEYGYTFTLDKQIAGRDVFGAAFRSELRICTYVAAASVVIALFAFQRHPPDMLERKQAHEAYLRGEVAQAAAQSKESDVSGTV